MKLFYNEAVKLLKKINEKNIKIVFSGHLEYLDKELKEKLEELKEEDFINKNAEYSSLYFEQWKKLVWKNIFYFFLPNMFFHMTTAYDIVRHFGFDVGKADFLWRATFDLFE